MWQDENIYFLDTRAQKTMVSESYTMMSSTIVLIE